MSSIAPHGFHQAKPASDSRNAIKTLAQIMVFWSFFLWVMPQGILWLQTILGIPRLEWRALIPLGWSTFSAMSALGLWSAWTMVRQGKGTPLPLDAARKLVIHGPYAHLRNPMATAGIGQGFGVGLIYESWPILIYSLIGAWAWQTHARPREEAAMLQWFGPPYEHYRAAVPCWRPRIKPYRGTSSPDR